jgi:hypothetical protein
VLEEFSLGASLFRDDSQDDCGNPFVLMSMRLGDRMLGIFFEVGLRSRVGCSDHHFLLLLKSSNLLRHIWLQECPDISRFPLLRYELLFLWRAYHIELGVKRWDLDLEARGVVLPSDRAFPIIQLIDTSGTLANSDDLFNKFSPNDVDTGSGWLGGLMSLPPSQ